MLSFVVPHGRGTLRPSQPPVRNVEMKEQALPPIVQAVRVSWSPAESFQRFTNRFAEWWPRETHSIGGTRVERIVFETLVGGRIFEQHVDGRRFQWGKVAEWDPPRRVRFSWHPSRDECTAQNVVVEFLPEGAGTQVVLTADGWERWGEGAAKARRMYNMGWGYVLNLWGEKRTLKMGLIKALANVVLFWQGIRGGDELKIDGTGGEIEPAHAEVERSS